MNQKVDHSELEQQAIPSLIKLLQDENWHNRLAAAELLGERKADAAIPRLIMLLKKEPKARVRRAALDALLQLDFSRDALPTLLKLTKDRDALVRSLALRALVKIRLVTEKALLALMAGLEDEDQRVRQAAADALGAIGPNAEVAVDALTESFIIDEAIRENAIMALSKILPEVAALLLLEELKEERDDQETRQLTVIRLGEIGRAASNAIPDLLECLTKEPPEVELAALWALAKIDATGDVLIPLLTNAADVGLSAREHVPSVLRDIRRTRLLTMQERRTTVLSEAAKLLVQLEKGELAEQSVALAAYLDHKAAILALEGDAPDKVEDFYKWLESLKVYGWEATARAAIAAARLVLPLWERQYFDDWYPRWAIEAVEDWIACPCQEHLALAKAAGDFNPTQWCTASAFSASWTTIYSTRINDEGYIDLRQVAVSAANALLGHSPIPVFAPPIVPSQKEQESDGGKRTLPEEAMAQIRLAIYQEVVPWSLKKWDPIIDVLS